MADHTTAKKRSQLQEAYFARSYGGKVSPSSGGADRDQGDVRTEHTLIECKHRGSPAKPAKSISLKLADLEKIIEEAISEGRDPAMGLTVYTDSPRAAMRDGARVFDLLVTLA